jgi:hypothetical protein
VDFNVKTAGVDTYASARFDTDAGAVEINVIPHGPSADGLAPPLLPRDSLFAVAHREESRLGGKRTRIRINGKHVKVPVHIDSPFFFGLKAYFTRGLTLILFPEKTRVFRFASSPAAWSEGQTWRFGRGDGSIGYMTVASAASPKAVVKMESSRIDLMAGPERLGLDGWQLSTTGAPSLTCRISPPLPLNLGIPFNPALETKLTMVLGEEEAVSGPILARQEDGITLLDFMPNEPSWASGYRLRAEITEQDGSLTIRQTIIRRR